MIETTATEQELFALLKNQLLYVAWPDRLDVVIKPTSQHEARSGRVYELSVSLIRHLGDKPSR